MTSILHLTVLFALFVIGVSAAGYPSRYYGLRGSYNPYYRYEKYEGYDPYHESDEQNVLPLSYKYLYSPAVTGYTGSTGSLIRSSLSPYMYMSKYLYKNEVDDEDDDDEEEEVEPGNNIRNYRMKNPYKTEEEEDEEEEVADPSQDPLMVAAVDSKGGAYLIPHSIVRTLQENGLKNEDGTLLVPNGAMKVVGEQAVDGASGSVTYVVPQDTLRGVEPDNVLAVLDDSDGLGRNAVRRRYYRRRNLAQTRTEPVGIRIRYDPHRRRRTTHRGSGSSSGMISSDSGLSETSGIRYHVNDGNRRRYGGYHEYDEFDYEPYGGEYYGLDHYYGPGYGRYGLREYLHGGYRRRHQYY